MVYEGGIYRTAPSYFPYLYKNLNLQAIITFPGSIHFENQGFYSGVNVSV